jgi:hypothetical protein
VQTDPLPEQVRDQIKIVFKDPPQKPVVDASVNTLRKRFEVVGVNTVAELKEEKGI